MPGLDELPALLKRLYSARGICDLGQLDYSLAHLPKPDGLKDIQRACQLIAQALTQQQSIMVVGDYDADGATSATLVLEILAAVGARRLDYFIPHRVRHGYGLSPVVVDAIQAQAKHKAPGLLITVDNGISSIEGVKAAQQAGWQVVITDHHLPGPVLPEAEAIINPNQPEGGDFGQNLAGVGVAFYLMVALRGYLRQLGWHNLPKLADYLDLVAVGTVADMVPLDYLNRLLVAQGLGRIRKGYARAGIKALILACGGQWQRLVADNIGFKVAPLLNAAGRIDDMQIGVACLRERDWARAQQLATQLAGLNQQRRTIQSEMLEQAQKAQKQALEAAADRWAPAGLIAYQQDWHEGIVGLVAGRLCEQYKKPAIAFACIGESDQLKGSARSPSGIHMRDILAEINAQEPQLIISFGGHARAAGLTINKHYLPDFEAIFGQISQRHLAASPPDHVWLTDGPLAAWQINLKTAQRLRYAGPWGSQFPAPCFFGRFQVLRQRYLKQKHLKMQVQPLEGAEPIEAIAFNCDAEVVQGAEVTLVYRLEVNYYRGLESANLIVEAIF